MRRFWLSRPSVARLEHSVSEEDDDEDWYSGKVGTGTLPGARPRKLNSRDIDWWHNHLTILQQATPSETNGPASMDQMQVDPLDEFGPFFFGPKTLHCFHLDQTRKGFVGPLTEDYALSLEMWEDEAELEALRRAIEEAEARAKAEEDEKAGTQAKGDENTPELIPLACPLSTGKGIKARVLNARQKLKSTWATYQMLRAAQNYISA